MKALRSLWQSYQDGLLAQAQAAADSTLAQYATGHAGFAAVLDANAVSISEVESSLQVLAEAWRLAIAQDELSADETRFAFSTTPSAPTTGM
jgi:hypothetical protein